MAKSGSGLSVATMLKYLIIVFLFAMMGATIWVAYPMLLNGSVSLAGDPASIPGAVYRSLGQHIPNIPTPHI